MCDPWNKLVSNTVKRKEKTRGKVYKKCVISCVTKGIKEREDDVA